MLDHDKINKLLELSNRTIIINEQLISEEKNYLHALSHQLPFEYLKSIKDKIKMLLRKEALYTGAALRVIQGEASTDS